MGGRWGDGGDGGRGMAGMGVGNSRVGGVEGWVGS